MNVLYVITSLNKGVGGHFYSLKTIVENLKSSNINPTVVCIGNSPIIESGDFTKYFFSIHLKISKIKTKIESLMIKHKIELIHSFDFIAFNYIRGLESPHLQTKCGGPYNRFIPNNKYITLFSSENLLDYTSRRKFRNTQFELIPNRVTNFCVDNHRVQLLKKQINYNPENKYILRICRISKEYKKSILQGYELFGKLTELGFKCKFVVIGGVYDKNIYELIKKECPEIIWLTDKSFTYNAKELIDFCDIYLGTGRGVMEATRCNKLIMVSTNNKKLPALLDQNNFTDFFDVNFSQRLNVNINEYQLLNTLVKILNSEFNKNKLFRFYGEMYDEHFNIENGTKKYLKLYNRVINEYRGGKITLDLIYKIEYMVYHKYLLARYRK